MMRQKSFEKTLKDNRSLRQQNIDSLDAQRKSGKKSNNPANIEERERECIQ